MNSVLLAFLYTFNSHLLYVWFTREPNSQGFVFNTNSVQFNLLSCFYQCSSFTSLLVLQALKKYFQFLFFFNRICSSKLQITEQLLLIICNVKNKSSYCTTQVTSYKSSWMVARSYGHWFDQQLVYLKKKCHKEFRD